MKRFLRLTLTLCFVLIVIAGLFASVRADGGSADESYLITPDGRRVPAPLGYVYSSRIGSGFSDPQDLFVDSSSGKIYVADSGNNRIVVMDRSGNVILEISEGLNSPEGVFVDPSGDIWIADTGNQRIAVFSSVGSFKAEYHKPVSDLLTDYDFSPHKVVVDRRGFIFAVTGSDQNLGVLVMDTAECFRGFFGRARTPFNLTRFLANLFATEAQRLRMEKVKPSPLGNIHLDADGFIYAVSPVLNVDQIQRLNAVGQNVYGEGLHTGAGLVWDKLTGGEGQVFGEFNPSTNSGSQFIDVAVDSKLGIVSALDINTYQIYQYDQTGNLIAIFGGRGQRAGMFAKPISIAAGNDGTLYVLDTGRSDIEVLTPTETMRLIHQATFEYFNGNYQTAADLWKQVAARNTNFTLAHSGLGKALVRQNKYLEAMTEYRLAGDQGGYSAAFQEYRYAWLRSHFGIAGLAIAGFMLATALWGKPIGKVTRRVRDSFWHLMDRLDLWSVPVLLALAVASWMISLSVLSFHFRTQRPEETRLIIEAGKILIPWITWCVSAMGISEIFFGRGNFKQIVIASARALWPLFLFAIPLNLLTNVLSLNEATLYQWLWYGVWALMAWQFFKQGEDLHDFDTGESILTMALSLLGIIILWALAGLVYALTSEIVRFIGQIILEIYVRRF
jgi:hypothetical protein